MTFPKYVLTSFTTFTNPIAVQFASHERAKDQQVERAGQQVGRLIRESYGPSIERRWEGSIISARTSSSIDRRWENRFCQAQPSQHRRDRRFPRTPRTRRACTGAGRGCDARRAPSGGAEEVAPAAVPEVAIAETFESA